MEFSEKLIKLRKIKGITQDEMASAVGVSRQAVYKWESGQSYPEVPKLIELHHLFAISIDDLLDDNYAVVIPETKKRRRKKVETAPVVQHETEEEVAINTSDEVINAVAAPAVKEEKIAEHIKTANVEPMKKPTGPAPKPAAPATPKPAAPAATRPAAPAATASPKPATAPVTPKPATPAATRPAAPAATAAPKPVAPATPKPAAPAAPAKEETVLKVPEAPQVEELPEEETKEDKRGFFGRLFNRK